MSFKTAFIAIFYMRFLVRNEYCKPLGPRHTSSQFLDKRHCERIINYSGERTVTCQNSVVAFKTVSESLQNVDSHRNLSNIIINVAKISTHPMKTYLTKNYQNCHFT